MGSICKEWQLSGLDVWAVTPLNARVRIISIGKHASMNGIDHLAIAKLVTAAPDLLASCEEMLELFKYNPYDKGEFEDGECPMLDRARAAIAKAKGQ